MRNYKKKTHRGEIPQDVVERAVRMVIEHDGDKNFTIRKVAKDFNLHYSTLSRYAMSTLQNVGTLDLCKKGSNVHMYKL